MKHGAVGGGVRVEGRARRAHHVLITYASVGLKFPFVHLFANVANGDTSSLGMHLPRCSRRTPYGCATNALVFSVRVLNVNAV